MASDWFCKSSQNVLFRAKWHVDLTVGSTIGWVVMIFGLDPAENSWYRYSRFCMRNRAHLVETQARKKEDGATSDKERGESVGKIGNSRKIICKRRLQVRPKIAPFARKRSFRNSLANLLSYTTTPASQDATSFAYAWENAISGIQGI